MSVLKYNSVRFQIFGLKNIVPLAYDYEKNGSEWAI